MPHPLVTQLRFTRAEFGRAIDGVTAEEAARRFGPINPLAWITGHLSWHEQVLWLERAQGKVVAPEVKLCGFWQPACDPSFDEMLAAWQRITRPRTLTSTGSRRRRWSGFSRARGCARASAVTRTCRRSWGISGRRPPTSPSRGVEERLSSMSAVPQTSSPKTRRLAVPGIASGKTGAQRPISPKNRPIAACTSARCERFGKCGPPGTT